MNVASLDPKTLASLRGYLDVAYRLGMLLAGMEPGGLRACRLMYRGEIAEKETKILTAVFAAGLLQGALDQEVNLVNAELVLKQRGIKLTEESRTEMGSFRSSMTAEVTSDSGLHKAAGTIFGQHMPRLVALDDFRLEAYLDGRCCVPPSRRAGHHRRGGHDFWPAQCEHRPDGGRPRGAGRRSRWRAQSGQRAFGRGAGGGAESSGDCLGDGCAAAARGPIAAAGCRGKPCGSILSDRGEQADFFATGMSALRAL